MSAPPSSCPGHPVFRRAAAADATALAELAERTFRETFAANNDPADVEAYIAQTYAPGIQAAEIVDPAVVTLLAEQAGEPVAFAQLRPGLTPPEVGGPLPVELWRFYVDRPHHGLGLARALMDVVLDTARRAGARTIWLGVWEHNRRAQAFYRKCGFVPVGAHVFVMGRRAQAFYRKCGFVPVGAHVFVMGRDAQTDLVLARPVTPVEAASAG